MHLTDSASGNSFGIVNIGGGVKGTSTLVSLVGDASPDLVLGGQAGVNNPVYVVDGAALAAMSGSVNLATPVTDVRLAKTVTISGLLPANWAGYTTGTIIPDCDGDGIGDFAVGEFTTSAAGRVAVFH